MKKQRWKRLILLIPPSWMNLHTQQLSLHCNIWLISPSILIFFFTTKENLYHVLKYSSIFGGFQHETFTFLYTARLIVCHWLKFTWEALRWENTRYWIVAWLHLLCMTGNFSLYPIHISVLLSHIIPVLSNQKHHELFQNLVTHISWLILFIKVL